MGTNREHFDQTEGNAEAVEEVRQEVQELLEDGITGTFEGTVTKLTIKNGLITEVEMEE